MKQNIEILIIASCEWYLPTSIVSSLMRMFFLYFEAMKIPHSAINSLDQAKDYLNKYTPRIIVISDNLAEKINDLKDRKNLGLKFYEELKNDPRYTNVPIVIQSFSEHSRDLINLREIDFYFSPETTLSELDKFIEKT